MPDGPPDSVAVLLFRAASRLGAEGRKEAALLFEHTLARSRAWLLAHGEDIVDRQQCERFAECVSRRERGEPIAQIVGRKGFWTFDLSVNADVLIPRPETERLVECALAVLSGAMPLRVADLGTGSGAIALAIARERPLAELVAVDASAAALAVARSNARALGLESRVRFEQGDWFAPLAGMRFHAVLSNPPYIAENDRHLLEGDLRFEPRVALASGPDGLDAIRAIARAAPHHLLPGGWLLFEHGWDQGESVRLVLAASGLIEPETYQDLEGRDRVSGAWLPG